ncbi:pyridoxamine 5'-phosphate oxidase family protein [Nocardia sp. CS682]|uniref:pyridoxamine 5'-phosphate oxidase family protein n=1 Tax=Nocardia sp. CS682 TaxID=1047172 RepID=UPI0010758B4D|nr:pyridoxamine 5'-phosphate oxidase family protein [Nocardia sp. CS682]QBS45357.1 pyridoxamine 5'-phosphate oxidase [Nocardia sp. CS682]
MIDPSTRGDEQRDVVALDRAEALRLLASTPLGRVVFTRNALPAIRPVNHLVDDGFIVVRTRLGAQFTGAVRGNSPVVVTYAADDIDPVRRTGWSVSVTGLARTVTTPELVARYEQLLHPWVDGVMDSVISIEPEMVTGIRLVEKRKPRRDG